MFITDIGLQLILMQVKTMSTFILYFRLGYRHVLDIYGVDHMLFVIAIMSVFMLRDWRRAMILFLFYVLGSSLSLSPSVNEIVKVDMNIIDYLIPVTVLMTAVINIFKNNSWIFFVFSSSSYLLFFLYLIASKTDFVYKFLKMCPSLYN